MDSGKWLLKKRKVVLKPLFSAARHLASVIKKSCTYAPILGLRASWLLR